MIHQRTIGIGIAALVLCCALATTLMAQCDCGSCGSDTGGEVYDSAVASFLQNVGTGPLNEETGCVANCCERATCPAIYCGPYVSAFGGWSNVSEFFRSQDFGSTTVTTTTQVLDDNGDPAFNMDGTPILVEDTVTTANVEERQLNFEDGFAGGIAIGRQVHQRARVELELTYRSPDFDSYQVQMIEDDFLATDTISTATGSLEAYALVGNFLFDVNPRTFQRFNFYGGAGIGATQLTGNARTATNLYKIDETSFVFQVIGGLNRTLTSRVDFFAEYRYVVADDVNVFDVTARQSLGDFRYKANEVFLGFRFRK